MDRTPKLIIITQKKCLLLESNTIRKKLMFKMKYNIDGGCLLDY